MNVLEAIGGQIWGLAAGIFNSIPYFGPFIVTSGLAAVAFLQFGTFGMTALIAGVALLITSLEGWGLTPALMGRVAKMNRVAIFGLARMGADGAAVERRLEYSGTSPMAPV